MVVYSAARRNSACAMPIVRLTHIDGARVEDETVATLRDRLDALPQRDSDGAVIFAFPADTEVDAKNAVERVLESTLPDWRTELAVSL
jgi:hypothetical protein